MGSKVKFEKGKAWAIKSKEFRQKFHMHHTKTAPTSTMRKNIRNR